MKTPDFHCRYKHWNGDWHKWFHAKILKKSSTKILLGKILKQSKVNLTNLFIVHILQCFITKKYYPSIKSCKYKEHT